MALHMAGFEWDALRHPRGPLPPAVYWLRRALVGLVVVAVVVGAVVLARPHHQAPARLASAPRSTPASVTATIPTSVAAAPTPASTPTPVPPAACGASLQLALTSSSATYPAGTAPTFTATLKNPGSTCRLGTTLAIVVESGTDRVWSSVDCPAGTPTASTALLTAGATTSASRTWQRTRTAPRCTTVDGDKTAAVGTYRATATWGGATSAPAAFSLR
jgi:hypothetical protein